MSESSILLDRMPPVLRERLQIMQSQPGERFGNIQIKTAAAGKILIDLKKITRLKTESQLTVMLADGTVLTGTLTATAPDRASVVSDQGQSSAPFALPDVRFIKSW